LIANPLMAGLDAHPLYGTDGHFWCVAAWLSFVAWAPAFAQDAPAAQAISPRGGAGGGSSGVEIAFSSGHADRGFILSDRPVIQPVLWLSQRGVEFSVWSNFTLGETTDGLRPQVVEMELTREREWKNLSVAPAIRMFRYHDALSNYSTRSIEAWLYLSYDAGPFRLFTNHSVDVLTYRGAYFGEAGIESERRVSPNIEVGGSFAAGWASATFNEAYADVAKSALDRINVAGWLTAHVKSHFYIGPHFEFSSIVDRAVRAELIRPTYFFVRLTTGAEF
jgi:hypothetical protein